MPEKIKASLAELHQELENVDSVDPAMLELLRQVDEDINTVLESQTPEEQSGDLMDRLETLGAKFAAEHPTTERFFQELISTLGRLGI